jgi:hypothetical protein
MTGVRERLSSRASHIRANPLEYVLLMLAFVAIGFTMYETVAVALAGDRTQDLTFSGTTAELGRTLSSNGPARIGRLDRATIVVGGDTVIADTIVVVADSLIEPAFATGGFLRDQVVLYNDYAIRQALLSSHSGARDGGRAERGRSEGRTLLRTVWADDGTRMLSDRPSSYGLAIRSPYAEGSWRDVRTTDWRSSPGLLGHDGDVSLPADLAAGLFQARLNGHDCNVSRETPQYYMYCQSTLAAEASRFYDFGFEVRPSSTGGSFGSAGPYRQRSVWMNGRAETRGQRPVVGGDVLEVQALGPFMLSAADWGTLAAEQWVNGRRAFANPRLGTLSFFAPAGRSTPAVAGVASAGPLTLSFDAALTADLDRETRRFMSAHEGLLSQMVAVILDVRTGEVKAIAEPARQSDDEPLLSFEPILVGSVVKPIMAAAILSRQPALGMLRIPYAGDTVTEVAGVPLRRGFANDANGCGGEIGFSDFLRCSSNQYAAELMVRSLQQDGWSSRGRGALVPRATLEGSTIATGLAEVFDVDAYANRTPGRLALYWSSEGGRAASTSALTTDRSLIPYESRPWILFPDSAGTGIDLIARYAFGGWENRWTLLGLAQAYARIATGRNVQATFLHHAGSVPAAGMFAESGPLTAAAFARVRGALRLVPINGTASGLADRLRVVTKDTIVILAKTGTLNERSAGGKIKSLAIAMGRPAGHGADAALTCGLVAITYFEFAEDHAANGRRVALPRIHRDFAEGAFTNVMSRHWGRVSGCTLPVAAPKPPLGQVASK